MTRFEDLPHIGVYFAARLRAVPILDTEAYALPEPDRDSGVVFADAEAFGEWVREALRGERVPLRAARASAPSVVRLLCLALTNSRAGQAGVPLVSQRATESLVAWLVERAYVRGSVRAWALVQGVEEVNKLFLTRVSAS